MCLPCGFYHSTADKVNYRTFLAGWLSGVDAEYPNMVTTTLFQKLMCYHRFKVEPLWLLWIFQFHHTEEANRFSSIRDHLKISQLITVSKVSLMRSSKSFMLSQRTRIYFFLSILESPPCFIGYVRHVRHVSLYAPIYISVSEPPINSLYMLLYLLLPLFIYIGNKTDKTNMIACSPIATHVSSMVVSAVETNMRLTCLT